MTPNLWSQVRGHADIKQKLDLMISKSRLPHCLLLVGVSGIGKRQLALALVQKRVCQNIIEGAACGSCGPCVRIRAQQSEDLFIVTPEKQSIKLAQAKEVAEFLSLSHGGKARFVLIDNADQLNPQAANSLLKLIEEPPPNTFFILIAPTPQSVLPTIRSRSQWLRFSTLSKNDLCEIMPAEPWMYEACQGSVEVLKSLTESESSCRRTEYLHLLEDLVLGRASNENLFQVVSDKSEALFVLRVWNQAIHDALVVGVRLEAVIHKDQLVVIKNIESCGEPFLHQMGLALRQFEKDIHGNLDRSLIVEALKIKVQNGFN